MVKKRGIVWNYFTKKVAGSQVIAFCKYCDQSYIQNATRMERHIERCQKCPEDIRQQLIQAAHRKKNKGSVSSVKKIDPWNGPEAAIENNNVTDTEIEDLDEWGYRNQIYNESSTNSGQPSAQLVMQGAGAGQWASRDDIQNAESNGNNGNGEWEGSGGATEPGEAAGSQERGAANYERRAIGARRIAPYSLLAMKSPFQSKIDQEQLLERRAARRTAEIELRRRTLELERLQWEFERDKAHSELRWAHENRMMLLKEEKERLIIDQNKCRVPHVI